MDARESKGHQAGRITNNNGVQISRCLLAARKRRRISLAIANPLRVAEAPAAPTGIRRFNTYLVSERRRIVAQVRREVLKNRDFFAVQDSPDDATIC
jgi:hypothetical protein